MTEPQTERQYRVYIAGSSAPEEIARAKRWSARLREAGIAVWAGSVGDHRGGESVHQRLIWAARCLAEVGQSDALWLLCPPAEDAARRPWVEIGAAYSRAVTIVASGDTAQSTFGALGVEFATDEGAFDELMVLAAAHRSGRR